MMLEQFQIISSVDQKFRLLTEPAGLSRNNLKFGFWLCNSMAVLRRGWQSILVEHIEQTRDPMVQLMPVNNL